MADYRCPMITIGIIHIIDGVLLPILWSLGWIFDGYVSLYAAPVWGGIVFLIPAGITGIRASSGNNRRAAMACRLLNSGVAFAAVAIIITAALITSTNLITESDVVAVGLAIATIVLGVLELILCCIAGLYSSRILNAAAMEAATVAYSGGGVANPGMQYPEAQVQIQYPAQPPQGQYQGAPDQGQYPGPPAQYPGPPAQGQCPGPPAQYPGPPAQGQYPGPQAQYPGPPAQGQYPGPQAQYPGPPEQGQYPGPPVQGQYPSAPVQYPPTEEQKY